MTATASVWGRNSVRRSLALVLALSPVFVITVIAIDARARRAQAAADGPAVELLARRLPSGDLALSGGARWLRAISLEEPAAAFADGPAMPDPDPAGAAMAPPVEAWAAASPEPLVVRRRSGQGTR